MLDMPDTTIKLIDVGAVLRARLPSLKRYPAVLIQFLIWCLRTLVNEDRINQFLQNLIDAVFIHKGAKAPDQKPDKHRRIML